MSYYVNSSQLASISIGGEDVTSSVIEWTVSDSSLFNEGLMTTVGSLRLARTGLVQTLVDYKRTEYPRGTAVVTEVSLLDGTTVRHPRGLLYVISTSYDPENVELQVDLGCRIALASLTDNTSDLLQRVPLPLDAAQDDFSSISASFAAAGKYLYQDNQGNLVEGKFFEGNRYGEMTPGAWVSILGTTTNSVSPLQSGGAIPDKVSLSYEYPESTVSSDNTGRVDVTETTSEYFVQYPGVVYVRQNDGSIPDNISTEEPNPGYQNPCGNSPSPPPGNSQPGSCSGGFETVQSVITLPAKRLERSESHYGAVGAQISYTYKEVRGPALELNAQYFADAYAACRYSYATKCNPGGDCPMVGSENVLQSYTEEIYNYGADGELVSKVSDTYSNVLSAAREFNWRSGSVNGAPQGFTALKYTDMYLSQRKLEEYQKDQGGNLQTVTTFTSNAADGSGLGIIEAEFDGAGVSLGPAIRTPTINGSFANLATSTDGGGSGMLLDVISAEAGAVKKTSIKELNNNVDYQYILTGTNIPVYGGSGTGMAITYRIERNVGARDVIEYSVTAEGIGYQEGDIVWSVQPGLNLLNGELALRVDKITDARVSANIKQSGTGYREGDKVWVTAATLVQAGAAEAAGQGNLVFEVQATSSNNNAEESAPGVASLTIKSPSPVLINGVYRGFTLNSVSGTGTSATADVYVTNSGAVNKGVRRRRPDSKYDPAQIGWEQELPAKGGSGTGATLKFRYNDVGLNNAPIFDGFQFTGIGLPGSGYREGDILKIKAEDLEDLWSWMDPDGDDLEVEVTEISGRFAEVYPVNAGRGYEKGDVLEIDIDDLVAAGAAKTDNQSNLRLTVASVVEGTGQSLLSINALAGKVTLTKTRSVTITTLPLAPDSLNSPTTDTVEEKTLVNMRNKKFLDTPPEAADYIEKSSVPIPLLLENEAAVLAAVEEYAIYLRNFTLGDALGLQIVENLTDQIVQSWYPGASFRYADPFSGNIIAMRADGCTWGLSPEEAGVSINGIFLGKSRGSLVIPDNLVGNILPVPEAPPESPTTPPDTSVPPPVVDGEGGTVNQGDYTMTVDVWVGFDVGIVFEEKSSDLSAPSPETVENSVTVGIYLDGMVVTAGSTLETTSGGGIPYSYKGSLLTSDAIVVTQDLFA